MLCGLFPKAMDGRAFSSQNQLRLKVCSAPTLACFILFIYFCSPAPNPWNFLLPLSQPLELLDTDYVLCCGSPVRAVLQARGQRACGRVPEVPEDKSQPYAASLPGVSGWYRSQLLLGLTDKNSEGRRLCSWCRVPGFGELCLLRRKKRTIHPALINIKGHSKSIMEDMYFK